MGRGPGQRPGNAWQGGIDVAKVAYRCQPVVIRGETCGRSWVIVEPLPLRCELLVHTVLFGWVALPVEVPGGMTLEALRSWAVAQVAQLP